MKKELVLKEWQADIVRDESKIIMVNTSRGGSKTFLLANKVLYEKPKTVLYICDYAKQLNVLKENLEEIFHSDETIWKTIKNYNFSPDKLIIEFITGEKITIYNKNFVTDDDIEIDMALFDNGLPQLDIKAKKYISVFTINYPIMNLFNNRGDINYYAVGLRHLERGLFTREQIEQLKNELSPLEFMRDIDVCNDYNTIKERWDIIDGVKNSEEKPIRGLRAKSGNIIDEDCNMNCEDIEEVLHKFDNPNKIDFESAIKKKKDNTDKKVQEFNSVINDNIDEIKKLFKSDYSEYIIRTSCDDKGYLKLIIKRTVLNGDKVYEFGHIEDRGDGHNIKEVTTNRLRNFVSDIYVKNNLKYR